MKQDIYVRVIYRDKNLKPTYTKMYTLAEYAESMRSDLQNLVGDVETLAYIANDNTPKEDWSDESFALFSRVKHKLLDKAGEIGRLPLNMVMRNSESISDDITQILDGEDDL